MATGAQQIVALLREHDVDVCFGLPGVHNLALWEALRESPIRLVGVRHEQTAAYAADGYARATGRLGVALTTTGPGAANTLGAVGEAWASRSPILVIATDIPSSLRRPGTYRGVLHETTDQAAMFAPVVKSAHLAHAPEAIAPAAAAAIASALAAPTRPVYLEVATDLLGAEAPAPGAGMPGPSALHPDGALDAAAAALAAAERPLIWLGGGARDAGPGVARLAERLAAPVLATYAGAGVLAPSHPCLVGMPPHVAPAGRLWDEADVVVAIGSDLDGVQTQNFTQPQPPVLIALNLDPAEPASNYRVDVRVDGDAGRSAAALADRVPDRGGLDALAERL
ncbi:MAG: 5-guanidino-2-oxopentanoate decarboxylase, partial [Solirubrobacteraceae bacterium]|nr:5-guanidino-2-oxopentanoate decarboxylase [Solirubrobacteraceae bacterium]